MRILFAGGGTAGHINPALAVADYMKERQSDIKIFYIGTERGLESRLVKEAGYPFYTVDIRGFQRKTTLKNIGENVKNIYRVFRATSDAEKILAETEPDIVVGTGGYVSGPVVHAAVKAGIKTAIHEQNAFPGVTTKLLAPNVDAVMLAMPDAERYIKPKNAPVITGNPVRPSLFRYTKAEARKILGLDSRPAVLSFGGSLGARPINEAVCGLLKWGLKSGDFHFFHATGKTGYEPMLDMLKESDVDINSPMLHLTRYIDNMDLLLPAADLVICRAGAITLSELTCCGKASILIPSPYVAENHQYRNALTLSQRGAAVLLEEKDLSGDALAEKASAILTDGNRRSDMESRAKSLSISDANRRIADVIYSLCDNVKKRGDGK